MRNVLVDTGPLVAWFDRGDGDHIRVTDFFDAFDGCLLTTWPVLTEVCHLLPGFLAPRFMKWVARGGLEVIEMPTTAAEVLAIQMEKYADLPMDLADASLLWLAEHLQLVEILTLDVRDFGVYCEFRAHSATDSMSIRPPVPRASGH